MWGSTILRNLVLGLVSVQLGAAVPTCNTPSNRACWSPGFTINTDYEASTPTTGITRSYTLTITEVDNWVGGDGVVKTKAMLINGQFPGPVITADWGDTISVTVINQLRNNGTSIHWHGIRQLNNNINDGANGVTECPIAPGHSKVYTFLAQQYGTSWYHSHFSSQYANGITGSIQINGPASLPYDTDLGVFPISDWYYGAAEDLQLSISNSATGGAPPPSDNVLFNGSNINPVGTGGKYAKVTLTAGKRHLLRLINPSVENNYVVSLVGHQFTVIAEDFVPIDSFTTSSLFLGIGQRYDVTIDASQAVGNYWFNVTYSSTGACGSSKNPHPAAIFSYAGAPSTLPTTTGAAPQESYCADAYGFVPVVSRTAPLTQFTPTADNLAVSLDTSTSQVFWKVNGSAIDVNWDDPTLEYVLNGTTSFPTDFNVLKLPTANVWSVWVIQNTSPVPHPMHLHGHDFLVLGQSPALTSPFTGSPRPFNPASDTAGLQTNNPRRRDVAMLPGFGWLALAFLTDNPGAWLMHCHIAWHVSQGLSVQFLERSTEIAGAMNLKSIEPNCQAWRQYDATALYHKVDSGL